MSVLIPPAAPADPAVDPLVARYLAVALRPGAEPAAAGEIRVRGTVRVGRTWVPLRAVATVAPRAGLVLRARVLGVRRLVEQEHGGDALRRTTSGQATEEDDGVGAARRAHTHRALAALWVPGALRPETGATWQRLDRNRLRVVAGDLDLRLRVHPHGHVLGVRTQGWGDPYGIGRSRWAEIGYEVHAWRSFGAVRVPSTATVAWFPGTTYGREIARLRLTSWEPRAALPTTVRTAPRRT
ncbi:DUF6544 family protein [Actinomycetospora sp. TBRC 11914]|uniref:DUF6544 family protein n=1 Tax=Actinomycetospora sp. TBRC 11914 TaxID=2729387 RepID=UPI00145D9C42|nr:DUF6544 family protein [Actinomycetospora sp. TBRC 11914]NMO89458.1 hypothetical protein [Actinomycetospora sp. TBRC 11914]